MSWYRNRVIGDIHSGIRIDLDGSVSYDIVDYDKSYTGLQLVLDNNKAIRFEDLPTTIFPLLYGNKLFSVDIFHDHAIVVGPIQYFSYDIEATAIQLDSMILPIAIDSKSVMRSKEDYKAELFDLLWVLMSGLAGTTIDQMLSYVKKHIHIHNDGSIKFDETSEFRKRLDDIQLMYYGIR